MAWEDEASRVLLLELWMLGKARRRAQQRALLDHLEKAAWVHASPRATEVTLSERHRPNVEAMLDSRWEDWRSVAQVLLLEGLPPTCMGLREMRRRQRRLPPLPARINRHTAASLVAEHSKASLGPEHMEMLGSTQVMRDGAVLFRPNVGLALERDGTLWTTEQLMGVQGIIAVTQRAIEDGTKLVGVIPEVVITVENLGAFVDLPKPDWLMLVFVPGWNIPLAVQFLEELVPHVRRLHFGDLDPTGIRIYNLLAGMLNGLEHWIPPFWAELAAQAPPLTEKWPEGLVTEAHCSLVRSLAADDRWSEQELVVLDPRMGALLEALRAQGGCPPSVETRPSTDGSGSANLILSE